MTALTEYQRLESPGLWRAGADEQRREVVVSVGDATLVLYDLADRALAHWSLPAVERLNPGETPALYRPGADAPELLEIEDRDMIGAIERVRQSVARRRPRPGRLRLVVLGGGLATVLALTVFWLPAALVQHAASVVPAAKRAELGARLLDHVAARAGPICRSATGSRALPRLYVRLFQNRPGRLIVLADADWRAAHLPGGLILIDRTLVEAQEDPAVVAGYALAEAERAERRDPLWRLLEAAGPFAAFRLLTTGDLPEATLADHAGALVEPPPAPLPDAALLDRFAAAGVPSTPYAYARDTTGETTLGLIEADPFNGTTPIPVLPDGDWVSLQGICAE